MSNNQYAYHIPVVYQTEWHVTQTEPTTVKVYPPDLSDKSFHSAWLWVGVVILGLYVLAYFIHYLNTQRKRQTQEVSTRHRRSNVTIVAYNHQLQPRQQEATPVQIRSTTPALFAPTAPPPVAIDMSAPPPPYSN